MDHRAANPRQLNPQVTEKAAWSAPGVLALVSAVASLALGIVLIGVGVHQSSSAAAEALFGLGSFLLCLSLVLFLGLTPVAPGEARVVQVFGRYHGTIRSPGMHWVNLFAERRKISTRVRNQETTPAKVNDADGN